MRAICLLVALFMAVSLSGTALPPLSGGTFNLTLQSLSGGGTSKGGRFLLSGGLGATVAGLSIAENLELNSGWVELYEVQVPELQHPLTIERLIDGSLRLTWPEDAAGSILESSTSLSPGRVWETVLPLPIGNSIRLPPGEATRFFRLRKP